MATLVSFYPQTRGEQSHDRPCEHQRLPPQYIYLLSSSLPDAWLWAMLPAEGLRAWTPASLEPNVVRRMAESEWV